MAVIAFKVDITDPDLVKNYADYVSRFGGRGGSTGREFQLRQKDLETRFAKLLGAKPVAASLFGTPDFILDGTDLSQALLTNLKRLYKDKDFSGLDFSPTTGIEAKLPIGEQQTKIGQITPFSTRGVRGLKQFGGTGLPTTSFTELLKRQVGSQETAGEETLSENDQREIIKIAVQKLGNNFLTELEKADKAVYDGFYNKSRNLVIFKNHNGKLNALSIFIPKKDFRMPPFTVKADRKAITLNLSASFERKLVSKLLEAAPAFAANTADQFIKGIEKLGEKAPNNQGVQDNIQFQYFSGSVLSSRAKLKFKKIGQVNKRQSFTKGINFLELQEIAKRRIRERMPSGPRRGPPLSNDTLTYRTGRFFNSVRIVNIDMRKRMIQYAYDPVYRVHEDTPRDPKKLVGGTIRETAIAVLGATFNVVRR